MYLSSDDRLVGLLAVSDPVKASTMEALETLREAGLTVIMATGDELTAAKSVAKKLGIAEVYGEVKPQDKLALVVRLQKEYEVVAMAGDGIMGIYCFDAFSPAEIIAKVETVGLAKARLPLAPMLLLAVLAGAFIGLGALYYVVVRSDPGLGFASRQVLGGAVFSLGLLLVVVAGAELLLAITCW